MKWRLLGRSVPEAPDTAGFADQVLPHLDSAHSLARWLVRDPTLAEDVVQEAMLRALRYFDGFRGDDARAWLLRIVRNAAYAALGERTALAEDSDSLRALVDPADDPETATARGQDRRTLDRALGALPPDLRECIVLKDLEGLSYKAIAEVTGVPIGTVMSRLWRARQSLLGSGTKETES